MKDNKCDFDINKGANNQKNYVLTVVKIEIDESKVFKELPELHLTKEQTELNSKGLLWESMGR